MPKIFNVCTTYRIVDMIRCEIYKVLEVDLFHQKEIIGKIESTLETNIFHKKNCFG